MKNIYKYMIGVLLIALSACTKTEFTESLPEIEQITASTIPSTLKRINIEVDQSEFDRMYQDFGRKITVKAKFNLFNPNGILVVSKKQCTIEIRGSASTRFVLKPLGILFDTLQNNIDYQLINPLHISSNVSVASIKTMRLRNSGNDFNHTMFKDLAYSNLAVDLNLNLETKYGEPAQVFVNDNYYGLMNIRTEGDTEGLKQLLNTDDLKITVIKTDVKNGNLEANEGDTTLANKFINAIYEEDLATLTTMLDVDNFIDYILYQDYIGNTDWPENNASAYSIGGKPFRFFLFDLDFAAERTKNAILPELEYTTSDIAKLFRVFWFNDPAFPALLQHKQNVLYQKVTPAMFNNIVDELAASIDTEIPFLIAKYQKPLSTLTWRIEIDFLKRNFESRDHAMRKKYNQ